MIYRALTDLGVGKRVIHKGDVFPASMLKARSIPVLEEMGKIAPASLPPLSAMKEYRRYTKAFLLLDIETAGDLLEADDQDCAKIMKVTEADVRAHKARLYQRFATPPPARD